MLGNKKAFTKVGRFDFNELQTRDDLSDDENQSFVSTGYGTETIKNGNVVKTNSHTKKSIAPQKQTIMQKNSKQASSVASSKIQNNKKITRQNPRMSYSLAGVNNPKNNSKKVETATKMNNAKINAKNNDPIKIQQNNNELILNRVKKSIDDIINKHKNDFNRIIADRKSRKIKNQNEEIEQRLYKIVSNIKYQRLVIDSKANEANRSNIHNNHQNRYANQNSANVTFGQQSIIIIL